MSFEIPKHCKDYIGKLFVEFSKEKYRTESDQMKKLSQPPLGKPIELGLKVIDLPSPNDVKIEKSDIYQLITERKSTRQYTQDSITLEELSYLLWCTQGVKQIHTRENSVQARQFNMDVTLRTVPSAGLRNPLDTYLIINRVSGLAPGFYRFNALKHKLVLLDEGPDWNKQMTDACLNQRFVGEAAVIFVWVCNPYRTAFTYGNRRYRYIFLDSGHVCQNLYLASESIGCGASLLELLMTIRSMTYWK